MSKHELELYEKIKYLRAENERLQAKVDRLCSRGIEDMRHEIERLRELVEDAFREGFIDGEMAGHPMGPRFNKSEAWENSDSKSEVRDE